MALSIITIRPQPDFHLEREFQDKKHRCFNMRPLFTIKPWIRTSSPSVFNINLARIHYGPVLWSGAVKIVPETLCADLALLADWSE